MTERDWEGAARGRLEKNVADTVTRIRMYADQIEREAKRGIESAAGDRPLEFTSYLYAAGRVVHEVQTMVFNLQLTNIIDAAADAEAARIERLGAKP
jgi:hypothetical protein